jgi:hypothetical protein
MLERPIETHPFAFFVLALVVQGLGAYLGHRIRQRREPLSEAQRGDLSAILSATMTLLALIIGFTFAMAVSRYNERKDLEVTEATAISAEYARADLLPVEPAARVRSLLSRYVQQRILFYQTDDAARLERIRTETKSLKSELWSGVTGAAAAAPTPVVLTASGMNDVLNSEIHTAAAWRYHIPVSVWILLLLIAFVGNLLLGLREKRENGLILGILPVVMSVPFLLIADIDSPRGGIIRVVPVNLTADVQLPGK